MAEEMALLLEDSEQSEKRFQEQLDNEQEVRRHLVSTAHHRYAGAVSKSYVRNGIGTSYKSCSERAITLCVL